MTFPPRLAGPLAAALMRRPSPDNAPVSGVATSPAISYEGAKVVCETGTANATTGSDSGQIPDVALAFSGSCSVEGSLRRRGVLRG